MHRATMKFNIKIYLRIKLSVHYLNYTLSACLCTFLW